MLSYKSDHFNTSFHNTLLLVQAGLGKDVCLDSVDDWNLVTEFVNQQGVVAIALDGYGRMLKSDKRPSEMPSTVKKQWIATTLRFESIFAKQRDIAVKLARYFSDNNLKIFVLKGHVVSECYPVPNHRYSCDMDCFLKSTDGNGDAWEKGNVLVEEKGYYVSRGYYKNNSFLIPGLKVENHRFLTPFRGDKRLTELEKLLQRKLRDDAGNDKMGDSELCRPPVMVSALFLIEHAFSHFLHEGLTLRHITDWMMYSRKHHDEIDWAQLQTYIDEFGFRRFFDAYEHVGEYVLGEQKYADLSGPEQRMIDSVWEGLDLPENVKGIRRRLGSVRSTFRAWWKYRYFSPVSAVASLWNRTRGFLFMQQPVLK